MKDHANTFRLQEANRPKRSTLNLPPQHCVRSWQTFPRKQGHAPLQTAHPPLCSQLDGAAPHVTPQHTPHTECRFVCRLPDAGCLGDHIHLRYREASGRKQSGSSQECRSTGDKARAAISQDQPMCLACVSAEGFSKHPKSLTWYLSIKLPAVECQPCC